MRPVTQLSTSEQLICQRPLVTKGRNQILPGVVYSSSVCDVSQLVNPKNRSSTAHYLLRDTLTYSIHTSVQYSVGWSYGINHMLRFVGWDTGWKMTCGILNKNTHIC